MQVDFIDNSSAATAAANETVDLQSASPNLRKYAEQLGGLYASLIESAWEAQWLLEYVKSARTLERQPRA